MSELRNLLTFRLSRLTARLNGQALGILRSHGDLTLTQWRVLVALDTLGDCTMSHIVTQTALDKAMISRAVTAMMAEGMLEAHGNPHDHRQQILSPTSKGRTRFEAARPAMRARQTALRDAIGETDYPAILRALDALDAYFDEGTDP